MIVSMTGFGEAYAEVGSHAYHVEIRSVNNRYLKVAFRLPEDFTHLEVDLEQIIRKRVVRGSLTLRATVRELGSAGGADVNVAVLRRYIDQVQQAAGTGTPLHLDLSSLPVLPGVCQTPELSPADREQADATLSELTERALVQLAAMRAVEGKSLAVDLSVQCAAIRERLKTIETRVPLVLHEYRDRLHQRIRELLSDSNVQLAETDLMREVAIYAERSDIREELTRLAAHLDQFAATADSPEPAGRKLEFIAQEMLREANTIGSKSGDRDIAWAVIEIKTAIDRLKEQVQNVE